MQEQTVIINSFNIYSSFNLMNRLPTPYHQHFDFERCETPPHGIHQLAHQEKYLDHLDKIHASAIFSLAEVSSSQFLFEQLSNISDIEYISTLRRSEIKYRQEAKGRLYTIADQIESDWRKFTLNLLKNGRSSVEIPIRIMDHFGKCVAIGHFEWFVFRKPKQSQQDKWHSH